MIFSVNDNLRVFGDRLQWIIQERSRRQSREWEPVNWGAYHSSLSQALNRIAQFEFRTGPGTVTLPQAADLIERIVDLLRHSVEAPAQVAPGDYNPTSGSGIGAQDSPLKSESPL